MNNVTKCFRTFICEVDSSSQSSNKTDDNSYWVSTHCQVETVLSSCYCQSARSPSLPQPQGYTDKSNHLLDHHESSPGCHSSHNGSCQGNQNIPITNDPTC